MGMVVRTNTMALNAYRQLGMNNNAVSKSLEKLSSGFRINRAGDDAAGLAISEKMKAQITGLETASSNAQDGISLIQTAEGNLNEVHDMLNRMVELSTKSANGTYTSTERQALQDEVNQLLEEIDRISKSANFNGTKLLNGTMGLNSAAFSIGDSVSAVKSKTYVGDQIGTNAVNAIHVNDETTQSEVKPEFVIDFKDLKFEKASDGASTTASLTLKELSINGVEIAFKDSATSLDTAATVPSHEAAGTASTDKATFNASTIQSAYSGKVALVGDEVFSVTTSGSSGLKFTWVGKKQDDDTTDTTAKVDQDTVDTWNTINTGNVVVKVKDEGNDEVESVNKTRDNCHLTNIKDAKIETTIVRTGASLTLTKDQIKAGAEIKIGEQTYTIVDKKEQGSGSGAATGNEIGIKDIAENDLLEAVTRQLSSKTTTVKDADGKSFTFTIGRGDSLGTIEIEEATQTNSANYSKFTEDDLKKAFSYTSAPTMASSSFTLTNDSLKEGDAITIGGTTYKFAEKAGTGVVQIGADANATLNNLMNAIGTAKYDVKVDSNKITIAAKTVTAAAPAVTGGGLTLQIGDTADSFNKLNVAVGDMSAKGLGLETLKLTGIMDQTSASDAISKIKDAINTVSSTRANMGALQNRLEHTINNLDVAVENLSSANSRIRDTDMAKEMMNYTKMNVLVQSAQAMLAQANQQPQSVLQLLQ